MFEGLKKYKLPIRFYIQNVRYRAKNYKLFSGERKFLNKTVVLIFSPGLSHPGLTDRLKAVVSIFHIAQTKGYDFKMIHTFPFELSKYLSPNEYDWTMNEDGLCHSIFHTKLVSYLRDRTLSLKENRECHIISYEGNIHQDLISGGNSKTTYSQLFSKLFVPSPYLKSHLASNAYYGTDYVAIHFRFVNSFEINEPNYPTRPISEEKGLLLEKICLDFINCIQDEHPHSNVLIFCDSNHFLRVIEKEGFKHIEGTLGHISYTNDEAAILKSFTDMYMIAGAKEVYAGVNDVLYASAFPVGASYISNTRFERRKLPNVFTERNETIYAK